MTPKLRFPNFLGAFLSCLLLATSASLAADEPEPFPDGPRKAIVSTTIFDVFRPWVNLDQRLGEISLQIDKMAADSVKRHGRNPDLFVLPENSLNRRNTTLLQGAEKLEGKITDRIGAKARQYNAYVIVCFNRIEDEATPIVYNVAVLFDRTGNIAGIYRKVFPIAAMGKEVLEGGKLPGEEFPVFQTDFARIGILVCWDMGFPEGPKAYAEQNAELIVWPTMSPQTLLPRNTCLTYGFHLVSATPRDNASIVDPTGQIIAQTTTANGVVSQEIDFDYRILRDQDGLEEGRALTEAFGARAGYRYSSTEDSGIFWSNDPSTPIGEMLEQLQLMDNLQQYDHDMLARIHALEAANSPRLRVTIPAPASVPEALELVEWVRAQGLPRGLVVSTYVSAEGVDFTFYFSHGWDWDFYKLWQDELLADLDAALPSNLSSSLQLDGPVSSNSNPWNGTTWLTPTVYMFEGYEGDFLAGSPFGWLWADSWSPAGGFWAYTWDCANTGWVWVHGDGFYYSYTSNAWCYILPTWSHAWKYDQGWILPTEL